MVLSFEMRKLQFRQLKKMPTATRISQWPSWVPTTGLCGLSGLSDCKAQVLFIAHMSSWTQNVYVGTSS